jgi:hypothetical protein
MQRIAGRTPALPVIVAPFPCSSRDGQMRHDGQWYNSGRHLLYP